MTETITAPVVVRAECIRTPDEFHRLATEWGDLFERAKCNHVFLSHEWMAEWWRHWGSAQELFVVQVRDSNERLIAIAPFYINKPKHRWPGTRILAFIGSTHVASDHLDI